MNHTTIPNDNMEKLIQYAKMFNLAQYGTMNPCFYGCPSCGDEDLTSLSKVCNYKCNTITCKSCQKEYCRKTDSSYYVIGHDPFCTHK